MRTGFRLFGETPFFRCGKSVHRSGEEPRKLQEDKSACSDIGRQIIVMREAGASWMSFPG